jgi:hypothetical protein
MSRKKTKTIAAVPKPTLIKGQCHEIYEAMRVKRRLTKVQAIMMQKQISREESTAIISVSASTRFFM